MSLYWYATRLLLNFIHFTSVFSFSQTENSSSYSHQHNLLIYFIPHYTCNNFWTKMPVTLQQYAYWKRLRFFFLFYFVCLVLYRFLVHWARDGQLYYNVLGSLGIVTVCVFMPITGYTFEFIYFNLRLSKRLLKSGSCSIIILKYFNFPEMKPTKQVEVIEVCLSCLSALFSPFSKHNHF